MPVIRACSRCEQKNRVPAKYLAREGRCGSCKEPLPPLAEPLAADQALFDEVAAGSTLPILVDFWAEWCGPCRMAASEVERVAADLAARFSVRGIPNFVVLSGGRVVTQQAGLVDHQQLESWLRSAAAVSA